jgi:hypothetical protein
MHFFVKRIRLSSTDTDVGWVRTYTLYQQPNGTYYRLRLFIYIYGST